MINSNPYSAYPERPEDDHGALGVMGRAAQAMVMATGVLFGLRSFGNRAHLFGELGVLGNTPELAAAELAAEAADAAERGGDVARSRTIRTAEDWARDLVQRRAEQGDIVRDQVARARDRVLRDAFGTRGTAGPFATGLAEHIPYKRILELSRTSGAFAEGIENWSRALVSGSRPTAAGTPAWAQWVLNSPPNRTAADLEAARELAQHLFDRDPVSVVDDIFRSGFGSDAIGLAFARETKQAFEEAWKARKHKQGRRAADYSTDTLYALARQDESFRKEVEARLGKGRTAQALAERPRLSSRLGIGNPSVLTSNLGDTYSQDPSRPTSLQGLVSRQALEVHRLHTHDLVDELMGLAKQKIRRLNQKINALSASGAVEAKNPVELSLKRTTHDAVHGSGSAAPFAQLSLRAGGLEDHLLISLSEEGSLGVFRHSNASGSVFTAPPTKLLPSASDTTDAMRLVLAARPGDDGAVVRPDELSLVRLIDNIDKLESELVDRHSVETAFRYVKSHVLQPFESQALATDSAYDVFSHQVRVRDEVFDLVQSVIDDKRGFRDQVERGLHGAKYLFGAAERGASVYVPDIEYHASGLARGAGLQLTGREGRLPFEIGGTVGTLSPTGVTARGQIRYVPDLFSGKGIEVVEEDGRRRVVTLADVKRRAAERGEDLYTTYYREIGEDIKGFLETHAGANTRQLQRHFDRMNTGFLQIVWNGKEHTYDVKRRSWDDGAPRFLRDLTQKRTDSLDAYFTRVQRKVLQVASVESIIVQNREADVPILQKQYQDAGSHFDLLEERNVHDLIEIMKTRTTSSHGARALGETAASVYGMGSSHEMIGHFETFQSWAGEGGLGHARRQAKRAADKASGGLAMFWQAVERAGPLIADADLHRAGHDSLVTLFAAGGLPELIRQGRGGAVAEVLHDALQMVGRPGMRRAMIEQHGRLHAGDGYYPYPVTRKEGSEGTQSFLNPAFFPAHQILPRLRQVYQGIKPRRLGPMGPFETGQEISVPVGDDVVRIPSMIRPGQAVSTEIASLLDPSQYYRTAIVAYVPEDVAAVWESAGLDTPAGARALRAPGPAKKVRLELATETHHLNKRFQDWVEKGRGDAWRALEQSDQAKAHRLRRRVQELFMIEDVLASGDVVSEAQRDVLERAASRRAALIDPEKFGWPEGRELSGDEFDRRSQAAERLRRREGVFDERGQRQVVPGQFVVKEPPRARSRTAYYGVEGDFSGRHASLTLFGVTDSGPVQKTFSGALEAKTGNTQSASDVLVFGTGAEYLRPASYEKLKRGMYSSDPVITVKRMARKVENEIRAYRQKGMIAEVNNAKNRLVSALSAYSKMSERQVRGFLGSSYDYVDLSKLPESFWTSVASAGHGRKLTALKKAGLTIGEVLKGAETSGMEAVKHLGLKIGRAEVNREARAALADQLDALSSEIRHRATDPDTQALRTARGLRPLNVEVQQKAANQYKRMARTLRLGPGSGLFEGVLDEGAFFDVAAIRTPEQTLRFAALHLALDHQANIGRPPTHGSGDGSFFDSKRGVPTNKRAASAMSTAILERSLEGGQFGAFLAARSGIAALDDQHVRSVVAEELLRFTDNPDAVNDVKWDPVRKALVYRLGLIGEKVLNGPAVLAAMSGLARSRTALLRTVFDAGYSERLAGIELGAGGRTHHIGPRGLSQLHTLVGRESRTRMRLGALGQGSPDESVVRAGDTARVLLGDGGIETLDDLVPFRQDADFFTVDLFNMEPGDLKAFEQKLRASGVAPEKIDEILMRDLDPATVLSNLMDDSPATQAQLQAFVAATGGERSTRITMPTFTGALAPEIVTEGTERYVSLPRSLAAMIDAVPDLSTVEGAIRRIHSAAAGSEVRSQVERLLSDSATRRGLENYREFWMQGVRASALELQEQIRRSGERHLAKTYKVLRGPHHMHDYMAGLERAERAGTLSDEVRRLAGRLDFELPGGDIQAAEGELRRYIRAQRKAYGTDVLAWRGFGIGEGFVSDSLAQRLYRGIDTGASVLEDRVRNMTGLGAADAVDERTLDGLRDKRLARQVREAQAARADVAAGVEGRGMVGLFFERDPAFQQFGGADFARGQVLSGSALRVLGLDPDEVNVFTGPFDPELRQADFDFDIGSLTLVDEPLAYRELVRAKNHRQALQNLELYQMLTGQEGVGLTDRGTDAAGNRVRELVLDEAPMGRNRIRVIDEGDMTRVLALSMGVRNNVFGSPLEALNVEEGAFLEEATGGRTEELTLQGFRNQQDIVGHLGAFAKRDSVLTERLQTEFGDRYLGLRNIVNEVIASGSHVRGLTDGPAGSTLWDEMGRVFSAVQEDAARVRPVFEDGMMVEAPKAGFTDLQRVAMARKEIVETAGIEKYPRPGLAERNRATMEALNVLDARSTARPVEDVIDDLLGGRIAGVDVAKYGGLDVTGLGRDAMNERKRRNMRRALQLHHDMRRVARSVANLGVSDDYLHRATDMPARSMDLLAGHPTMSPLFQAENPSMAMLAGVQRELGHEMSGRLAQRLTEMKRFQHILDVVDVESGPRSLSDAVGQALGRIGSGGRFVAAAAGFAVAVGALAAPDGGVYDGEHYDWPGQPPIVRRGSAQTTARALSARERGARERDYHRMPGRATGQRFLVPPRPSRTSMY